MVAGERREVKARGNPQKRAFGTRADIGRGRNITAAAIILSVLYLYEDTDWPGTAEVA